MVAGMMAQMSVGGATQAAASSLASRRGDGMGSRVVHARVVTAGATRAPLRVVAKDYPTPDKVKDTDNYRQAEALSSKLKVHQQPQQRQQQRWGGALLSLSLDLRRHQSALVTVVERGKN